MLHSWPMIQNSDQQADADDQQPHRPPRKLGDPVLEPARSFGVGAVDRCLPGLPPRVGGAVARRALGAAVVPAPATSSQHAGFSLVHTLIHRVGRPRCLGRCWSVFPGRGPIKRTACPRVDPALVAPG